MQKIKPHEAQQHYVQQELFSLPPDGGREKGRRLSIKKANLPLKEYMLFYLDSAMVQKLDATASIPCDVIQGKEVAQVVAPLHERLRKSKKKQASSSAEFNSVYKRLLLFWELFPFILPSRTRREVYEPAYNDLLADYLKALPIKTKWAKRWLALSFTFRTACMVADCLLVMIGSKFKNVIWHSIAEGFRRLSGG